VSAGEFGGDRRGRCRDPSARCSAGPERSGSKDVGEGSSASIPGPVSATFSTVQSPSCWRVMVTVPPVGTNLMAIRELVGEDLP